MLATRARQCQTAPLYVLRATKMSFVKKFSYAVVGLLVLFFVCGMFLPATARVTRTIEIDAPPANVFALVNDFNRMRQWMPWMSTDPNALYTISGAKRGVGASLEWDGPVVGTGHQSIVESEAFNTVVNTLDLGDGAATRSIFELTRSATGTHTIWTFETGFGFNIAGRYFGLLLDGIVGTEYEQGLISLKQMAERLPPADYSDIEIEHATVEAIDIAYLPAQALPDAASISSALGSAYFEILNFVDKHNLQNAGSPLSIGSSFDGSNLMFDAAIPVRLVTANTPRNASGVQIGHTYAGDAIRVTHVGSYRTLGRTHDKISAYIAAIGLERNGPAWEVYVSDPTRVAEEALQTYVYYPIIDE